MRFSIRVIYCLMTRFSLESVSAFGCNPAHSPRPMLPHRIAIRKNSYHQALILKATGWVELSLHHQHKESGAVRKQPASPPSHECLDALSYPPMAQQAKHSAMNQQLFLSLFCFSFLSSSILTKACLPRAWSWMTTSMAYSDGGKNRYSYISGYYLWRYRVTYCFDNIAILILS